MKTRVISVVIAWFVISTLVDDGDCFSGPVQGKKNNEKREFGRNVRNEMLLVQLEIFDSYLLITNCAKGRGISYTDGQNTFGLCIFINLDSTIIVISEKNTLDTTLYSLGAMVISTDPYLYLA